MPDLLILLIQLGVIEDVLGEANHVHHRIGLFDGSLARLGVHPLQVWQVVLESCLHFIDHLLRLRGEIETLIT